MSDNQTIKPNALVVMVTESPHSIPKALSKIVSRSPMQKPVQKNSSLRFTYLGKNDFSRSPIQGNHPEEVTIDSVTYYKYQIHFYPISFRKRNYWLIHSRFSAALKEFVIKNLELEFQKLGESISFLEVNLPEVKDALENGESLKGQLSACSTRIDCFGDSGLEKVVLRGGDVFTSTKYNSIWSVLSGGLPSSLALHSVVLLFETGGFFLLRNSLGRRGLPSCR